MTRIRKHCPSSREDPNIVRPYVVVTHDPKMVDKDGSEASHSKIVTRSDETYRLKALTRTELLENNVDANTPLSPILKKARNDVGDGKGQQADGQESETETGEKRKLRVKSTETRRNDAGDRKGQREDAQDSETKTGEKRKLRVMSTATRGRVEYVSTHSPEDRFPKGRKYIELAQVFERNEATVGEIVKLCRINDGRNRQCPKRAVEGLLLCEHHLNKARSSQKKKTEQVSTQTAEDRFPKGWKYKGLAQIAESDEATTGPKTKLCGRTDGRKWHCPLKAVEGLFLCEHHLNKVRINKERKAKKTTKTEDATLLQTPSDS